MLFRYTLFVMQVFFRINIRRSAWEDRGKEHVHKKTAVMKMNKQNLFTLATVRIRLVSLDTEINTIK